MDCKRRSESDSRSRKINKHEIRNYGHYLREKGNDNLNYRDYTYLMHNTRTIKHFFQFMNKTTTWFINLDIKICTYSTFTDFMKIVQVF